MREYEANLEKWFEEELGRRSHEAFNKKVKGKMKNAAGYFALDILPFVGYVPQTFKGFHKNLKENHKTYRPLLASAASSLGMIGISYALNTYISPNASIPISLPGLNWDSLFETGKLTPYTETYGTIPYGWVTQFLAKYLIYDSTIRVLYMFASRGKPIGASIIDVPIKASSYVWGKISKAAGLDKRVQPEVMNELEVDFKIKKIEEMRKYRKDTFGEIGKLQEQLYLTKDEKVRTQIKDEINGLRKTVNLTAI